MATSDRGEASKAGADITNVFVLMLENHSFDNVFAMSGIEGIRVATPSDTNTWTPPEGGSERTAHVAGNAPWTMTTDPGHEFEDVVEQLTGVQACCPPGTDPDAKVRCSDDADCYRGGTYPPIDLSGFATNYAYSRSEDTGRPATAHVPDIMACFDTRRDLPVIHQLATEFAICDAWFSSLPGPTWPNRFFV
ncbi:MAG TPA: alkaline phosphatase family protein, partial [Nitriliruptoraceae bacterium]|nr:alkaline phosphatase family protein [Nitriliruptoraceae bacterium]